ncbi:MAG TPA: hypothetical protein VM843_00345 [Flavisolibacter sp.]|nr:hypothetical protein [Flavisolibacter sp.]
MSFSIRNNVPLFSSAAFKAILGASLIGGTLDLLGAFAIYGRIMDDIPPARLLQSLASVLIGGAAFKGGEITASMGLALHYLLVFGFAVLYFIWFPFIPFFRRQKIGGGLLYGLFIWIVTSTSSLPISHSVVVFLPSQGFTWHFVSVQLLLGLPLTIVIRAFYRTRQRSYVV